jgi:glutathione synthase/RimK-type ligase-like ATP-grasp enzyme
MVKTTLETVPLVQQQPKSHQIMSMPTSWIKKLRIPKQAQFTLQHGSLQQPIKLQKSGSSPFLQISSETLTSLGIVPHSRVSVKYKRDRKMISIGPLIGVMISRFLHKSTNRPFGPATAFCLEMTEACRQAGASLFFFTPKEMKTTGNSISGYAFYQDSWIKKTFPIPHVIYNRLTSRRYDNLAHVQQSLQKFKTKYHTKIFNEKYLNKTEVFQALRKEESVRNYLPESHHFKNCEMLETMAHRYESLFLKPITGSLGKGIIKIQKKNAHQYECHFAQTHGVRKQKFSSIKALHRALLPRLRKQNYQIQQGLKLLTVQSRPIDFRALVQKNEQGKWAITSIVGRIASPQHFVSNVARGGSMSKVKVALAKSSLRAQTSSILHKLRQATLRIAQGIEQHIPSHFGELGIDLAVDRHSRVWLIEVNSKPSKDDNTALDSEVKIRPSVKNVVKYAKFLSKF